MVCSVVSLVCSALRLLCSVVPLVLSPVPRFRTVVSVMLLVLTAVTAALPLFSLNVVVKLRVTGFTRWTVLFRVTQS